MTGAPQTPNASAAPNARAAPNASWRDVPRGVVVLGLVSLLMDVASELVHALLPLLLVTTLGVGVAAVGLMEGVAEATVAVTKVFSGVLSDRSGRRKRLAVLGYGLGALSKPVFPLAGSAAAVLGARVVDRVGKGIRGAPRDALVADLTPPALRGTAYGLRQALDSVGAFAGPLAAAGLMLAYGGRIRAVLWWAVLPAVASVALAVLGVREPPPRPRPGPLGGRPRGWPLRGGELAALGRPYWAVVGVGVVFTLARFSEAFLVLDGPAVGLPLARVPLVLVAMNAAYALAATPAGALSDRVRRPTVLAAGMLTLAGADLVLARSRGPAGLFAGAALWGVHLALSQGVLAALVADTAPGERRGTAFGMFNLATGGALLAASAAAGALWQAYGPAATFGVGGGLAVAAAVGLAAATGRRRR